MNMFKPTAAKTPDEYLAMLEEPRKSEMITLHELIKKTIPNLKPHILAGMIGYGTFHYKSKSGREGDWSVIAISSRKNYISVYVCAADGKQYLAEKRRDKFPNADIGRSCIRFKKLEDIDLKELQRIIVDGVALTEKNGFAL